MKNDKLRMVKLWLLPLLLFFVSCSAIPVAPVDKDLGNPAQAVQEMGTMIAKARMDHINLLSPRWFSKAERAFAAAKKGLESGDALSMIQQKVSESQASLQQARDISVKTNSVLSDVIKRRLMARDAGAANLGEDYTRVERNFLKLTEAVEKDDIGYARRNSKAVGESYRSLEIRAIKKETIGEVRKLMAAAEKNDLRDIAPESYLHAVTLMKDTDDFISKNPYEKETMKKKADDALFAARRLNTIAAQSVKIKEMPTEKIALWMESLLYKTTSQLSARDMRDQTFSVQLDNILGSIQSLQDDHTFMINKAKSQEAQLDTLYKRIAFLEKRSKEELADKARLSSEKRFNELFNKVQGMFTRSEADVYKQKNQLVIRLKAIQFPVGQDIIMPENYGLLSKVQLAIRTFGQPQVVIEGHTDSTGSEVINEYLSQQRADSVRKYLVANQTLPLDHIAAVGYGSEKPLASNATAEGRAINRRIDVVIRPKVK
ncbi:MAG: OmpA family protein [Desulfobacteraceae bacterium]|nr:OmpA family protein [Desulfobacteraceae bacterium]